MIHNVASSLAIMNMNSMYDDAHKLNGNESFIGDMDIDVMALEGPNNVHDRFVHEGDHIALENGPRGLTWMISCRRVLSGANGVLIIILRIGEVEEDIVGGGSRQRRLTRVRKRGQRRRLAEEVEAGAEKAKEKKQGCKKGRE